VFAQRLFSLAKNSVMVRGIFIAVISVFFLNTQAQTTKKVLFLGNSYTYVNDLPKMVADLAKSLGDTVIYSSITPGGQRLSGHAGSSATYTRFKQNTWDYIVLQDQSQLPSFPISQVRKDVFPYAKQLCDSIHALPGCAKPVFFMTWGRENGDQQNCKFYSPLCTYEGMQLELRKNYLTMANTNNAFASPVGMVWRDVRKRWPTIDLYNPDGSHPAKQGSYVAACTFYAVFFGKSPVGASYKAGLAASQADSIQKSAAAIVFDSLKTWNIKYDTLKPSFTYTVKNDTVTFTYTGSLVKNLHWDFGDGNTSSATSPTHIYGVSDTFEVVLTVDNKCLTANTMVRIVVNTKRPSVRADFNTTLMYDTVEFQYSGTLADSVKWDFGNGKTDTGFVVTYIYGVADTFLASVKAFYQGAEDSLSKSVITTLYESNVSVQGNMNLSEFDLSIFPNPVENKIGIKSEENMISIEILDLNGRMLKRYEKIESDSYQINSGFLNSGTYIVQVETENQRITRRIIKK
tara:strand:+ start:423 stop:1973 length:1551 start_codon:yes stop_codon:yes gene_type:complete